MAAAARASSSRSSGEGAFASSSASPVAASGSSVADAAGVGASADGAAAASGCVASVCSVAVVPARRPSADGAAAARSCGAATVSVTTIGLPSAAVPSGGAEAGAEVATGGSAARVRALSCAGACFGATGWSGAASETSTMSGLSRRHAVLSKSRPFFRGQLLPCLAALFGRHFARLYMYRGPAPSARGRSEMCTPQRLV